MVRSEDLTIAQREALDAIVLGKLAWSPAVGLFAEGHDIATLEQLVSLGVAVWWSLCGEMQITLTPYGASVMRVHIIERLCVIGEELEEDPFWIDIIREASSVVLPKRRHEIRWPWMDELPDPKSLRKSGEVMRDEDGEPVKVLGMEVPVDQRLKGKGGAKQPKRRRAG